jgi:hypothetical protein
LTIRKTGGGLDGRRTKVVSAQSDTSIADPAFVAEGIGLGSSSGRLHLRHGLFRLEARVSNFAGGVSSLDYQTKFCQGGTGFGPSRPTPKLIQNQEKY